MIVLASLMATPALAQEARKLDIKLTAKALHDDNVARSNEARAALRGVEREDTIYSPALSIDIVTPVGRQALFLNGSAGYDFYQKNDQLNRENINIAGGANTKFGPCASVFSAAYQRHQSDLRDLTLNTVAENAETTTSLLADGRCVSPVGLGVIGSVSQSWGDNSAQQRVQSNHESTSGSLGVLYSRPTLGDVSLVGRYSKVEYPDRMITVGGVNERDGYENYSGVLNYTRRLGARLQGSVSAGYTKVEPKAATTPQFDGTTYGADITYRSGNRLDAAIALSRAAEPSNQINTTYTVTDSYSLTVGYSLGSRIKLGAGGTYRESDYKRASTAALAAITHEEIKSVFGNVRVNVGRRLGVVFEATQEERDADIFGADYTSNRVGVTLIATY